MVMSEIFKDMIRTVCHQTLQLGSMRGSVVVTVRFRERPDEPILKATLDNLILDKSVARGEIWSAVTGGRAAFVRGRALAGR